MVDSKDYTPCQRSCVWHLRYASHDYCKMPWRKDPRADPAELNFGCPKDCPDYQRAPWRTVDEEG